MQRAVSDEAQGPGDLRPCMQRGASCQGPEATVLSVVPNEPRAPHRQHDSTQTGAAGRFFVTPHAVHRFQQHYRPDASYNRALGELVRLTSAGRLVGPAKGEQLRAAFGELELWRGPRVGTHARQSRVSRLRFIVGRNESGLPQVVTVLRSGRE